MPTTLTPGYPARYESRLTLRNGRTVFFRPILHTDGPLITDLLDRMSPQSVYLRFLRRLDAFPEKMLHRFTHVDYNSEFALVAVVEEGGKDAIIAVGRYGHDPDEDFTDLGVAVRDDWHHLGLGKAVLAKIVDIARDHGISRFTGMMDPHNTVMRQTLLGLGYDVKYSLRSGNLQVDIIV